MSNQNSNSAWKNIIEKMKKNEEQLRKKERKEKVCTISFVQNEVTPL